MIEIISLANQKKELNIATSHFTAIVSEIEGQSIVINDARSASFFALGRWKSEESLVNVFLLEQEVPNILSAVTESHLMRAKINFYILGNSKFSYFSQIFGDYAETRLIDQLEDFCKNIDVVKGSNISLYFMNENNFKVKKDYNIPKEIRTKCTNRTHISKSLFYSNYSDFNDKPTLLFGEYGQLSQVYGMSLTQKNSNLEIVLTLNDLLLDLNAFSLRTINQMNCKILLLYKEEEKEQVLNFLNWFNRERNSLKNQITIQTVLCEGS